MQGTEQRIEALCALAEIEVVEHAEFVEREVQQRSSRQKKLAKAAAKSGLAGDAATVDPEAIQREVEGESAPGLDKILGVIVAETAPSPQYAKYHVLDLQRAVAKLLQAQQGGLVNAVNWRELVAGACSGQTSITVRNHLKRHNVAWKGGRGFL